MNDKAQGDDGRQAGPTIAMVGRPNVGKSTLFNRLTRSRRALVTPVPGTTRDRREAQVRRDGYRFRLVDTGGMGFGLEMAFGREIEQQIGTAVAEADLVWLVLDVKDGLNPFDEELHRWVAGRGKPSVVVVNKADNPERRRAAAEFYALGSEALVTVSAEHGLGIDALLEASAGLLAAMVEPEGAGQEAPEGGEEAPSGPVRVAFLGRPNVGKSSLVNRVLGEGRQIVSETPGTTREAVEIPFRVYGGEYVLVDTAGIRRRARTTEYLDKLSVLNALAALRRVDVAVLVVDASEPLASQDARIAAEILAHQRAVVIAANKWDRVGGDKAATQEAEAAIRERLRFLSHAALVRTSAVEGTGLRRLFREIVAAGEQFGRRIQTADLNRVVEASVVRFPPPARGRSPTRVYYGLQTGRRPPSFAFYTNHVERIDDAYTRFFENQLRYHFGLKGTPLRIEWRTRSEKRERRPPRTQRRKSS